MNGLRRFNPFTPWLFICALFIAQASCSHGKTVPPAPANQYVDAAICADCHTEIANTYSKTGMARSFYSPDATSVPNPKAYFHRASGTWYQIVAKDGGWYQRWWQIGFKGQRESSGESKIDYVMGSGNHVRTYLHRTAGGTLIELPLAWYAEKGGSWALNPGLDMSEPATGRKVGYDCMFCHNSYPAIPRSHEDAGSEPVYTGQLPQGIDCQRCHGPGGNHIRALAQPGARLEDIRSAIVNPARLGKERALEVCMQCHLETTSAPLPNSIRRFDRGPFSYRPGELFSGFQLSFDQAPGSGREGKFEIVNAVYRLRQSKCFLESNGVLGCTTCHNPHDIQHGQAAVDGYNKACLRCHDPQKITVQPHLAGSNCVGCHMPKRRAEDVVHVVMTDHLIQRRPPADLLREFPEKSRLQWEYHGEVVPYGDKDDLYTAIAQVTHSSNLEDGIKRLQAEIARRKPERPEVYKELGDALQRSGRSEESASAYRTAIEIGPDSAVLWARLAMPLRALGKSQEALDAMLKSVQLDPSQPEIWYNLGLLQSGLGDKKSAIDSFRKSIDLDPEFADSRNSLGYVLAETGQVQEAEVQIRSALSLRPAMQAAHANLAYLLQLRGSLEEAISHFERAGDGAFNQFSYGMTLARMNRISEAVSHYREAIRLQPDFGKAHLELGAALERQGDRAGAAAEFRAAQTDPDPKIREGAVAGLAAVSASQRNFAPPKR